MRSLAIKKTGEIPGYGSRKAIMFASYADVWSALQPALAEEGLSVGFSSATLSALGHESEMVRMTMVVCDGATLEEHPFEMIVPEKILNSSGSSVTNSAQRVANAESFLKRTALIHFFGIATGNEDEVERMNPVGDQTNIPGVMFVDGRTTWQGLMDGMWCDVMSPLHDGKIGIYAAEGDKAMVALWQDFPDHPALMAWAGDWINGALESAGLSWADVMETEADLPGVLTACNAAALRRAAKTVKQLLKERSAA
jgi:hypothetical protein